MFQVPQWINWRPEPPDKPGDKPKKVPFDLALNRRIDPHHEPTLWLTFEEARRRDATHVGYVLTANDPYFCIDLDHSFCSPGIDASGAPLPSEWSAFSRSILAFFPGAYVEVSYSGDGLHIFGRGSPPPGFKTRATGIELYDHDRFIAITLTHASGSPEIDFTAALAQIVPVYLKPSDPPGVSQGWTTAPVAEYCDIPDDADLIRRMITARASAGVAFGGKASAGDLWNANVNALANAFPSQTDDFGRSEADAALAAHLAFWTGKNCERILRLMRQSKLARPKWDRDDYMARTIIGAAARTSKVYTGPPKRESAPEQSPSSEARGGYQYLTADQQAEYFKGCVYIINAHRVWTPDHGLLAPPTFKATFGGYEFQMSYDRDRPSKNAFEAFTESRATRFPKAHSTCFRPELPPGCLITEEGLTMVNIYKPANVVMTHGDVSLFTDLIARLFPDATDRAHILAYLAALVQFPGVKFQWAPVIQGTEGNGKSVILACAEYAVGRRYTHRPNAQQLGDSGTKFNGWLIGKILIAVEEIYVSDRRDVIDALKPLLTNDRVEMQNKGENQVTGENRANWIMTTNHRNAIPVTIDSRRYAIFFTPQQELSDLSKWGMTGDYFPRLYNWLRAGGFADVAGYLSQYAIPDAINPATNLHRAPKTSSFDDAVAETRGLAEQEILDAIEEGRAGFRGGWISSVCLARLFAELGRRVAKGNRGKMLASLGYYPHPKLPGGRATTVIFEEDMKRPTLYASSATIAATDEVTAMNHYINAQGYPPR